MLASSVIRLIGLQTSVRKTLKNIVVSKKNLVFLITGSLWESVICSFKLQCNKNKLKVLINGTWTNEKGIVPYALGLGGRGVAIIGIRQATLQT